MKSSLHRVLVLASLGVATSPSLAWAHLPEDIPVPPDPWTDWNLDPLLVTVLALMLAVYATGLHRVWTSAGIGRGIRVRNVGAFAASMLALVVALLSSLDIAGGLLFSAHMVQHLLLTVVAAPLLVLARPLVALAWATPRRFMLLWKKHGPVRRGLRILLRPSVALVVHVVSLWAWHVPALYDAALQSEAVHLLEHFSFWASSVLFWWAIVEATGRFGNRHGVAVLCTFLSAVAGGILGALLTVASTSLYPGHQLGALAYGMTALEDQQLAGLCMWVPGGAAYVFGGLWALKRWLDAAEARVNGRERATNRLSSVLGAPRTELS